MPFPRLKRAFHRATGRSCRVWHHVAFQVPIAGAEQRLGIDPRRSENVLTWLLALGVVGDEEVVQAPEASWEALQRVHDHDYLASLDDPAVVARILGVDAALIATAPVLELWRRGTGATVEGLQWAIGSSGCAINLGGGFHHAHRAAGTGFCGLNDIAVAIRVARMRGFTGKICIVDVDAHPPDGIADCIDPERDGVRLVSVGVQSAWQTPDWVRDHRVAAGAGDGPYLEAIDAAIDDMGKPDVVMVLAGADPLAGDRYGGLGCTPAGLEERDARLRTAIGDRATVLMPAGGYTNRAWRAFATSVAVFTDSAKRPSSDFDPLLNRTRRIAKTLEPESDGARPWLTGADLADALGLPADESRFLGMYSEQGIAYALSRYGLLDTLTRMGFQDLRVALDTSKRPHLMRLTAQLGAERVLLFELAAQLKRVEGLSTVFIDWLTLRDPRVPFDPSKPRLPGQEAPGLGMGRQALALILALGERAEQDAIAMVPSHYHVAWMVRKDFAFIDAEREGRFRALVEATHRQPLARVSERLGDGGITTELDQVVRWDPGPMIWPLSEAARATLARRQPRADAAQSALQDAILPA